MKDSDQVETADTLGLHEAAAFVRLHYQTLRERAKAGQIPGACKPGKEWVFLRAGLVQYLEKLSPYRPPMPTLPSTLTYHQREAEYAAALGLSLRPKRMTPTVGSSPDGIGHLLGLPTRRKRRKPPTGSRTR